MQANERTAPVILAFSGAVAVPVEGASRLEGGLPVRRFRKDLLRTGQFTTPSGVTFAVNEATLDSWALKFSQMRAAGIKIPIPETHERAQEPSANRGWLVDLFRDKDRLIGVIDLVGDGIKLAGTTDVSVYAPAEHRDSAGNVWQWPIMHVALCTDPVVTGLGGFVPIAASQGAAPVQVPVLQLQIEGSPMPDEITPAAASTGSDASEAIVQTIVDKVVALVKDKTQTAQQKKQAFGDYMKKLEKALGIFDEAPADAAPAADAAAKDAVAASRSAARPVDPMVLRLSRENRQHKLDALVSSGKQSPAVVAGLISIWLPNSDQALNLSLSQAGCDQFDATIAALAENDPVLLGEHTRGQAVVLSGGIKSDAEATKNRKEAGAELAAMTARAAGMKLAK